MRDPCAARSAGNVRVAPRGIVANELRASGDARRPLGVSGFQREGKQDAVGGGAAVGEASDRRVARYAGIEKGPIFRRVAASGRVGEDALTARAVWQLVREYAAQVGGSRDRGGWRRTICGARQRSYADRRVGELQV